MVSSDSRDRLIILGIGLLLLLGPVVILALTLGALVAFGALALGQVTFVEFLELYLLELILFVGLSYGIYRLNSWLTRNRLPDSLDALDTREPADPDTDDPEPTGDAGNHSE